MKILLGIAAVFVLCIGAVAWKAYSWWTANGKVYVTALKTSLDDGKTFGRTADNAACVTSAFDRFGSDTAALGIVKATSFMQGCLPESKPTPGFCDGVPKSTDFAAAREWVRGKCDAMVSANAHNCRVILGPVPRYCHPRGGDSTKT